MLKKRDSEVEQWVLRELSRSEIRSREISVYSRDGVITLRGSVKTYQDKLAVAEAARRATGVVGVFNEMRIKPSTALIRRVPFTQFPLIQPIAIQRRL